VTAKLSVVLVSASVLWLLQPSLAQENVVDFSTDKNVLHIPYGSLKVAIEPAFEDYSSMLFDVCDAMELNDDECLIFPMMGDLDGNAIATVRDSNRIVVYDRELSPRLRYAGAQMMIAHEVGHHFGGHLDKPLGAEIEIEADRFAAAAMRLIGLSLDDTLSTVSLLSERPSKSHPKNTDRVRAMVDGWEHPETGKQCGAEAEDFERREN
jgi:hypothetical protein